MAFNPNGTFLQVSYGGYDLTDPSTEVREDITDGDYVEPGYTTMSPVEFVIDKADSFYFIIRKRENTFGTTFEGLSAANLVVNVVDITLDTQLDYSFQDFSSTAEGYSSLWEDGVTSDDEKIILRVDNGFPLTSPTDRIRVIDCIIRDIRDDTLISFRVLVDDFNKNFNFIAVKSNEVSQRNTFSTVGSSARIEIDGKGDSYFLISPFSSFREVSKGSGNFAYPLNTIFYLRQATFNQEGFSYSIKSYSHDFLLNNVRVQNVPGFLKMGVATIDRNLYNDLSGISGEIYMNIEVRGLISEMTETFKINFNRK